MEKLSKYYMLVKAKAFFCPHMYHCLRSEAKKQKSASTGNREPCFTESKIKRPLAEYFCIHSVLLIMTALF